MTKRKYRYRYRSAVSGRFVSKLWAAAHPRESVREAIKLEP